MSKKSRVLWVVSLVISLSMGCDDDDNDTVDDSGDVRSDAGRDSGAGNNIDASPGVDSGTDARSSAADAAVALTEGEVVGLASAINNGEIQAGTLAATKAGGNDVRDYATMMVTMHTAANARAALLGIAPQDSAESSNVQRMAATVQSTLDSTPAGAAFDSAYIDSQVTMHQSALTAFDTMLLPNAKTPALTSELTRVRGEVVEHLQRAQTLQRDAGL